jgi:hypothetical protein
MVFQGLIKIASAVADPDVRERRNGEAAKGDAQTRPPYLAVFLTGNS